MRTSWLPRTRQTIVTRDDHRCALCGRASAHGEPGVAWSVQHRMARGAGGSSRPETWSPANGIILCGSGTTGCHGEVERRSDEHRAAGLWLPHEYTGGRLRDPADYPIQHAVHGLVLLTHTGGWVPVREPVAA